MKQFVYILLVLLFQTNILKGQAIIVMKKENGIYTMPCKVNGLPLKLIFDTGASNVSISLTEANFMIKNDFIDSDEIKGTQYFQIASGELQEGTEIILREIQLGDITLKNVPASVVHELDAPLLLGQSALNKFNKILFDYSNNTLTLFQNDFEYQTYKYIPRFEDSLNSNLLDEKIYSLPDKDIQILSIKTKTLPDKTRSIEEINIKNNTNYDLKYLEIKYTAYDKVLRFLKEDYLLIDRPISIDTIMSYRVPNLGLLLPKDNTIVFEISDWDI
jgi:clan AA aspartic protease (TIGR02281 family)